MWQGSYVPAILIEHSSTSQEAVGFAAGSAPPQAGALLCEQEKEIEKIYQNIKNIIYTNYYYIIFNVLIKIRITFYLNNENLNIPRT